MSQPSNRSRTTKVIRIPKRYEFLIRTYIVWLTLQDQAKLWSLEEYFQEQHDLKQNDGIGKGLKWKQRVSKLQYLLYRGL